MILKLCNYEGCKKITGNGRYCEEHTKVMEQKRKERENAKAFQNAERPNESLYNSVQWRQLRHNHLIKYDFCVMCGTSDNLTVDHISAPRGNPSLFFNADNLQTLCKECHRFKTAREIRKRNQKKD